MRADVCAKKLNLCTWFLFVALTQSNIRPPSLSFFPSATISSLFSGAHKKMCPCPCPCPCKSMLYCYMPSVYVCARVLLCIEQKHFENHKLHFRLLAYFIARVTSRAQSNKNYTNTHAETQKQIKYTAREEEGGRVTEKKMNRQSGMKANDRKCVQCSKENFVLKKGREKQKRKEFNKKKHKKR